MTTEKSTHTGAATTHGDQSEHAARLAQERNEYLNGWKRALADYENFKRESTNMVREAKTAELVKILRDLLPLKDTLDKALSHVPPGQHNTGWYQGLTQMRTQWENFMNLHQVKKIDALGKPFDPAVHEAIHTEQHTDKDDDTILSVASDGYLLDTQLIRPAQVTVNALSAKKNNN